MKTKEQEIQKKINELCDLVKDSSSNFILLRENGRKTDIALHGEGNNDKRITVALASTIEYGVLGKHDGAKRLSEIILSAVEAVMAVSPDAGLKISKRFAKAVAIGALMKIGDTEDELDDNDNVDNEEEDCANCEFVKSCANEAAIKYRKEHGMSKPRKNKKGGRKVNVN
jgi:hypothetical protein